MWPFAKEEEEVLTPLTKDEFLGIQKKIDALSERIRTQDPEAFAMYNRIIQKLTDLALDFTEYSNLQEEADALAKEMQEEPKKLSAAQIKSKLGPHLTRLSNSITNLKPEMYEKVLSLHSTISFFESVARFKSFGQETREVLKPIFQKLGSILDMPERTINMFLPKKSLFGF